MINRMVRSEQDDQRRAITLGYPISIRIPEPGTFSKRFPSTVSTCVAKKDLEDEHCSTGITMGLGLTHSGIAWTLLSILGTCLCCVGFIFPFWITGSTLGHTFHFGVFRRCNYPTVDHEIVTACGRYSSFQDIPTLSWQLCTLLIGVGCCLAMLVAATGLLACCLRDLVTHKVGRAAGVIQLLAAFLIGGGCILYPIGWDHAQVKTACGSASGAFRLGECYIAWAYIATIVGCGLLFVATLLSCQAGQRKLEAYQV